MTDPPKLTKLKQVSTGGSGHQSCRGCAGERQATRFARVCEILEVAAEDGRPYHSGSGRFWKLPRAEFIQSSVYGLKVVETEGNNRGARSNLVKALKGEAPFDGTDFGRMPLGRPALAPADIDFIQKWIDDGCPKSRSVLLRNAQAAFAPRSSGAANRRAGRRSLR